MNNLYLHNQKSRNGVSLIELLLVTALLTILGTVMLTVFISSYRTYTIETKRAHIQLLQKGATETMTRKIQQGQTVVASQGSYTTSGTTVIIRLASIDANKDIIPSTYDYIVYRRNPSNTAQLQEITIGGTGSSRTSGTRTLLDNLTSFAINYYNQDNVQLNSSYSNAKRLKITLTSQESHRSISISSSLSQFMTLRNK